MLDNITLCCRLYGLTTNWHQMRLKLRQLPIPPSSLWRQLVPHITHETCQICAGCANKTVSRSWGLQTPQKQPNHKKLRDTYVSLVEIHRCSRMQRNIYSWPLKKGPTTEMLLTQQRKYWRQSSLLIVVLRSHPLPAAYNLHAMI